MSYPLIIRLLLFLRLLPMKNLCILLLVLSVNSVIYGQLEASNWYFGDLAGLTFNNGEPEPLIDGQLDSLEGCSSISTADGDLLFYTNGQTVWNRFHMPMTGGDDTLAGSDSSTQAALIVPQPGNPNRFFVFTTDAVQFYQDDGVGNGINYSIVDLTSGAGTVVQTNIPLLNSSNTRITSEKITAVAHANGNDIWVITHANNDFYAFEVTTGGVNSTPVVSPTPFNVSSFNNIRGAMKASPRGDRLAIAHTIFTPSFSGELLLYDFDPETGVVSNQEAVDDEFVYYGVEFSSDDSRLYASGKLLDGNDTSDFVITQFDLESADVSNSRVILDQIPSLLSSDLAGSLQLAVDRKVYYSRPGTSLSVINNPNELGTQSDFDLNSVPLGFRTAQFGLPPFIQSFFESIFEVENLCFGDATQFTIFSDADVGTATWDFGDPASGAANTSTALNPTHMFSAPGTYIVTLDATFTNGRPPKTFMELIEISPNPQLDSGVTLVQCDIDGVDDGITLFNLNEAVDILNDAGFDFEATFHEFMIDAQTNTNPINPVGYQNTSNGQTLFFRVFENPECVSIGELTLQVVSSNDVGNITVQTCQEEGEETALQIDLDDTATDLQSDFPGEITFYSTESDALLELNEITDDIDITQSNTPQLFFRSESNNECAAIGGLFFDIAVRPDIENQSVQLCNVSEGVELSIPGVFDSYLWSTGETTPTITVFETGAFTVEASNSVGCSDTATITVEGVTPLTIEIEVRDFRQNNSIIITTNDTGITQLFSINGGLSFQANGTFENVPPGAYLVVITDELGCNREEQFVIVRGAPAFFTPNEDGFNDFWHVDNAQQFEDLVVRVYDRFGKLLAELGPNSRGWDGMLNGRPLPPSSYWYTVAAEDGEFTGHFALVR